MGARCVGVRSRLSLLNGRRRPKLGLSPSRRKSGPAYKLRPTIVCRPADAVHKHGCACAKEARGCGQMGWMVGRTGHACAFGPLTMTWPGLRRTLHPAEACATVAQRCPAVTHQTTYGPINKHGGPRGQPIDAADTHISPEETMAKAYGGCNKQTKTNKHTQTNNKPET